MRSQGFALLILLCFGAVPHVLAQEENEERGRQLIEDFVNDVQSMSARFEQQLVSAEDEVVDESSGTLEIQRPGRFRWTYLEPYEQILVADGLNVWSYDVDLEQVTVKAQAEVLANTPALLLGGSQNVLDDFDYVGSFTERDTIWVSLRPKTTDNGFTKVELGFDDGRLNRMIFADSLGQTTLIALFDLSFNDEIDEHRFNFSPPENVDVVGRPIVSEPAAR